MRGMNQVTLEGNLGADPTQRIAKSGAVWCTFSIATSRSRKDGENWVDETQWHEVKAFGAEAERAISGLKKGVPVRVTGRLEYDKWVDAEGQNRRMAKIVCESLVLVPRAAAGSERESAQA